MREEQREDPEVRLEGLVLRDSRGWLYEVPCLVIERYRVPEERAMELARGLGDGVAPPGDGRADDADAPWVVRGGVYVSAADTTGFAAGQFPALSLHVRAFGPSRRSHGPRRVVQR
jgi:hypothetical protein